MQTSERIRNFYDHYLARDFETVMALVDDDATFRWMANAEDTGAFSGIASGKAAFHERLLALDDAFEYVRLDIVDLIVQDERAAVQIIFTLRRRSDGPEFEMPIAGFWRMRDGRLVDYVEYYDTARGARILVG